MIELVRLIASDGLRLDGILHLPEHAANRESPVDAAVYLHGAGANFCSPTVIESLMPVFDQLSIPLLRINTRGHDLVFTASAGMGRRRLGAAYEIVDECRHDVTAAVDFLVARGNQRVALVGHSLGAIKAVYAQAQAPRPNVQRVIAISPPRLSYSAFRNGPDDARFFKLISQAQQLVAEGRGEELFESDFPVPLLIAAKIYLDKYGPDERYNILKFAARVPCAALYVYGEKELTHGGVAFAGLDRAVAELAPAAAAPIEVATVAHADHFYSGVGDQLATVVAAALGERGT